jgi:predicted amidohydrolase
MTSTMRLGVVQNEARWGADAPRMLQDAVATIAQAKQRGVNLLVFPETYPGPISADVRYEVLPELQAAAAKHNIWVVAGTTDKAPGSARAYYIASVLISGSGDIQGRYRRTHPRDEVYRGLYGAGPWWEFDYVEADDFPTFDLPWGKLGISICSEVFVPEVARTLADRGAELVVFPTGAMIHDLGFLENWQTLVRARAIENIMYTATSVNLFNAELRKLHSPHLGPVDSATGLNQGHALIASPETILGTMRGPGILTADLDFDYIRRMRRDREFPDGLVVPPPYTSLPGLDNLKRPELSSKVALDRRQRQPA